MQNLPLVSIVTPTYNQAEYLAEAIESVLAQDYPNIEYIVLDDGSTDGTPGILRSYEGRIRQERHENRGQAYTLNRGWAMAHGVLFGYLSSDDRLERSAITRLVQALKEEPSGVVAYCDFELIDSQGRKIRTVRTEEFSVERLTVDLVSQPGPGALFDRQVFDRTGGWTEHLKQVPDFEFWLRASCLGSFVRVPEVLAYYRIHEGSASFRPMSSERAMEIVDTMTSYWCNNAGESQHRSMANAYLIAAKSHAQSGRFRSAFSLWCQAVRTHISVVWSRRAWRMMFAGFLRRIYYTRLR